jgi:hypothetical protein
MSVPTFNIEMLEEFPDPTGILTGNDVGIRQRMALTGRHILQIANWRWTYGQLAPRASSVLTLPPIILTWPVTARHLHLADGSMNSTVPPLLFRQTQLTIRQAF